MTTVVVVHKSGTMAIAADSLVTFGDTRLAHGYEANEKLFRRGNSWIDAGRALALGPCMPPMTRSNRRVILRNSRFAPVANSTKTPVGRYVPTPSP